MTAAPLVWINGFPGTGKYTIAKQLLSLLGNEKAILIDNNQLIDPVEEEMARNHPEYQNVRLHPDYQNQRREKRATAFEHYVMDASMLSITIIFTDFQSRNELAQKVATEYVDAARRSGRPFLPINLTCEIEENMRRVQSGERQRSGCEKLKAMWTRSKLLSFCDMESFNLDVTQRSPQQAAMVLRDHVSSKFQDSSEMMDTCDG